MTAPRRALPARRPRRTPVVPLPSKDQPMSKATAHRLAPRNGVVASTTPTGIKTTIEQITPDIAEEWLGRNSHNRSLRNNRVAELAGAMSRVSRGEWRLNGDAIRWSKDGVLLDGQHRLWAIVESGVTIETIVVRGLDDDSQQTVDLGARRNLKDTLALRGYPGALALAAALSYKWRYDNGHLRLASARPSIPQALALLEEHPGLATDAIPMATRMRTRFRASTAMLAIAYYEMATVSQEDADIFWQKLLDGTELKATDPIHILRSYMERQAAAGGARFNALTLHALINKAWNHWRQGEEVERLSWKAAGLKAEAFPLPR